MKPNKKYRNPSQETKHTPGPWRINYRDVIMSSDGIELCSIRYPIPTSSVAGVYYQSDYASKRDANARLIAAAPEMLAWLLFILDTWNLDEYQRSEIRDLVTEATGGDS